MDDKIYILSIFVIGLSVVGYFITWMISAAAIVILLMLIVFVRDAERTVSEMKKDRNKILDAVIKKLDNFSGKLDLAKNGLGKQMFALNSKVSEQSVNDSVETERNFRELARKIIQLENRINEIKRSTAT